MIPREILKIIRQIERRPNRRLKAAACLTASGNRRGSAEKTARIPFEDKMPVLAAAKPSQPRFLTKTRGLKGFTHGWAGFIRSWDASNRRSTEANCGWDRPNCGWEQSNCGWEEVIHGWERPNRRLAEANYGWKRRNRRWKAINRCWSQANRRSEASHRGGESFNGTRAAEIAHMSLS